MNAINEPPATPATPPHPLLLWVRTNLVERTLRRLPKSPDVLDLCCGYGFYFQINPRARGVDGDPVAVDLLRQRGFDVVQHDVLSGLPFASGSFRHVIAHDVLEHFTLSELPTLLDEVHRVLAPGGHLWVFVPNKKGYDDGLRRDVGHRHFVTRSDIEALRGDKFILVRNYTEPLPRRLGERFTHNKEVFVLVKA